MLFSYAELSIWQVSIAAALILINAGISLALQLGLHWRILIASIRTVGQLFLIGLVLDWVFEVERWYIVLLLMVVMTTIAGFAAVGRVSRRYPHVLWDSVVSMWASSWLITAAALLAVSSRPALVAVPLVLGTPVALTWLKLQARLKRDGRLDQLPGVVGGGSSSAGSPAPASEEA